MHFRFLLSSAYNDAFFQSNNPGAMSSSSSYQAIKSIIIRNFKASSNAEQAADSYKRALCDLKSCPPTLDLGRLLSAVRLRAVFEHFRKNSVDCSGLVVLSLKDVKVPPDVMQLLCSAVLVASLQTLDVTNCALTDNAAEALSPLFFFLFAFFKPLAIISQ
jgi:hypothetical protein